MRGFFGGRSLLGRRQWLVLGGLAVLCALLLVVRYWPRPPLSAGVPQSLAIYARDGQLLRLTTAADEQYRVWVPLSRLDPKLAEGVMLYEDRWFRWHPGVNPVALVRASWATFVGGSRQGASTLSMQLARRLYNIDSRSFGGKLRQIFAAISLEARYSKDDILEAYLNLAPFGGNVEGVEAAALVYFHKPAMRLNLPEALALAVIPQNPNKRLAGRSEGRGVAPALTVARGRLWQDWLARHPEDERLAPEMDLPLKPWAIADLPFMAPHFTDTLVRENQLAGGPGGELESSLDPVAQRTVERMLRSYLEQRRSLGVRNAAALLVHAPSMEMRALVGSADFFNKDIAGQVNGMAAKRSPGSTLKPFIYGLALDQGLIHPKSILRDAPTAFGPFSPENFDGRFAGPVTAQEALIRSRNVPAVGLGARISRPGLYDFLKMAGVSRLAPEKHYGLALTLGGGETTGEELARMYALLANGGMLAEIGYRTNMPATSAPTRLLSEEASFVVLDMLRHNRRPESGLPASPPVAWKTGTSWGFRDAWTAGVFGEYVLVVWVGNFDSTSNPALVGIQIAAPLFFRIVDSLRAQKVSGTNVPDKPPPAGVRKVEVCAASGDLPNAWCRDRTQTWFIPGKSPIRVSTLHRRVLIDERSGRAVCSPGEGVREEIYEYWSSDMLRLFRDAGMPRREPPPAPDCASGQNDTRDGLQITSPLRATTYTQRVGKPVAIALRADRASGAGKLYWFADDAYLGSSEGGVALGWTPERAGNHVLRVVDETGRSDNRIVAVEFAP